MADDKKALPNTEVSAAEMPGLAEALTPEGESKGDAKKEPKKEAKRTSATRPTPKRAPKPGVKAAADAGSRTGTRTASKVGTKTARVDNVTARSVIAKGARGGGKKTAAAPARAQTATPPKVGESPLEVNVFDVKGARSGEIKLPEVIFGQEPNMAVMHQALQRQLNNARQGTSATKKRGQVRGGGRKPFRQKGLGRSRHGSEREPSMVGGGVVFGPQMRSFRQEMPRKMRRLALRSALSVKASEGRVSVIDGFEALDVPRTRTIVDMLGSVGVEGRTLLVLAAANEMVSRSAANLPWAKTILASNLNLYDIFTHDHVVIAKDALELIEETFA